MEKFRPASKPLDEESAGEWIEKIVQKIPELDISQADLETSSILYFRELLIKMKQDFVAEQGIADQIKQLSIL